MDEFLLESILGDAFTDLGDDGCEALGRMHEECPVASMRTFEQAGVMTHNRGLVVRFMDGSEFQVRIVRAA